MNNCGLCFARLNRRKPKSMVYTQIGDMVTIIKACNSCHYIKKQNHLVNGKAVKRFVEDMYILREFVK